MVPILKLDKLTRYFAGLAAVKDVSFKLESGGLVGLIGPNGAGKTTLLSLVGGSLPPTSGKIEFEGHDLTGAKSFQAVRAGIARTHQIPKPFLTLTVLENVEVGLRFGRSGKAASSAKSAVKYLELVGIAHLVAMQASALSVGDLKRLELARALAARPSLLLCDEVCSGLTETETASILRLLCEIRGAGTTILYVEHNLRAIMSVCNPVIVMNYGQKLIEGPPETVQNDSSVIEAYIGKKAAS
ncbi:MAG: ABC transporter ATP-binding protein [Candidatus Acidiferrales bacterium]